MFVFNLIISQVSVYLRVHHQVIPRIFLPGGPRPSSEIMVWLVLSSMCPPGPPSSRVLMLSLRSITVFLPGHLHSTVLCAMVLRPALQGVGLDFSEPKVALTLGLSLDPKDFLTGKMSLNLLSFWQNIYFSTYSLW